ncbi:MAG: hypothetical protein V3U82_09220 [Robiginitomaculum sp.]
MMKLFTIISAALVLTACGNGAPVSDAIVPDVPHGTALPDRTSDGSNPPADIDYDSYSMDMAKFVGLEIGESHTSAVAKISTYFTPEALGEGKQQESSVSIYDRDGGSILLAISDGLMDDSVKGESLYAIFSKDEDGAQTLVTYGLKAKCWRGENKDNWQIDLCP